MISGAHVMIFTQDEDADRAFLRDVLEIPCIESGVAPICRGASENVAPCRGPPV